MLVDLIFVGPKAPHVMDRLVDAAEFGTMAAFFVHPGLGLWASGVSNEALSPLWWMTGV